MALWSNMSITSHYTRATFWFARLRKVSQTKGNITQDTNLKSVQCRQRWDGIRCLPLL